MSSAARDAIAKLVPHQGAMCLLEEVLEWSEDAIVCRATSHRDPANPLRSHGGLAAIMGVEYAAQAVAAHGSLKKEVSGLRAGYLASLRDVACFTDRLDLESADITVRANRIAAQGGRLLYDFRIEGGGRELLKGRLAVVHR